MKGWFEWAYRDMLSFFPENVSTFGAQLDGLFSFVYWVSVSDFLIDIFLVNCIHYQVQSSSRTKNLTTSMVATLLSLHGQYLPTFLIRWVLVCSRKMLGQRLSTR
jgi:hypothetical protein